MRRFLIRLAFFLLPVALLAYPADLLLSAWMRNMVDQEGELVVMKEIYNGVAACDIAVYGSSRAAVHFDSFLLEDSLGQEVYNFGINAYDIWMEYMRHLLLLQHNRPPKTIILSLDAFGLERGADLYNYPQFVPYLLWNPIIHKYTRIYNGFSAADYYVPLVRYTGERFTTTAILKGITGRKDSPNRRKGYAPNDWSWRKDLTEVRETYKTGMTYRVEPECIAIMEELIKACQRQGISIVLVYSPEYIEGQKFIRNHSAILSVYRMIAAKHHLLFLDYTKDSMCYNRDYFYNSMHLNTAGATLFSKKLAHDLLLHKSRWQSVSE